MDARRRWHKPIERLDKSIRNRISVIMISGHATIETAIEATKLGARDFLEKPVSIEKLLTSAQEVLTQDMVGEDVFPI